MTPDAPFRSSLPAVVLLLAAVAPAPAQEAPPPPPASPAPGPHAPAATPAAPLIAARAPEVGPSAPPAPGQPGYLGVVFDDVAAEDVEQLGLPEERGALVRRVVDGSPADSAGFQAGDVVLEWGGEPVFSASELARLVRETPPGRDVRVRVFREGRRTTLTVAPGERDPGHLMRGRLPPDAKIRVRERLEDAQRRLQRLDERLERVKHLEELEHLEKQLGEAGERMRHAWKEATDSVRVHAFRFGPAKGRARLGVRLHELGPQLAEYFGLADRSGVLVASVRENSPAEEAGLRAGDVLLSVAGRDVDDTHDAAAAVAEASGEVEVRVLRRGEERTLTVRLPADGEGEEGS